MIGCMRVIIYGQFVPFAILDMQVLAMYPTWYMVPGITSYLFLAAFSIILQDELFLDPDDLFRPVDQGHMRAVLDNMHFGIFRETSVPFRKGRGAKIIFTRRKQYGHVEVR